MDVSFLLEPKHSLQALATRECDLKVQFIQVQIPRRATPMRGISRLQLEQLLDGTIRLLELNLALGGFVEAAGELGFTGDVDPVSVDGLAEVRRLASTITGRDPFVVLSENAEFIRDASAATQGVGQPEVADWDTALELLVTTARALVSSVPIDDLTAMATLTERPEQGHRCRSAYDALRSFVRRRDPSVKAVTRAAGRAYAEGRLTLGEVAALLGLPIEDAVFVLEEHGFHRPVDVLQLTPRERDDRFARLRADRLARGGAPAETPDLVRRDVVASQRIEKIDARGSWTSR